MISKTIIQRLSINDMIVGYVKRYHLSPDRKSWIFVLDLIATANEEYQCQVVIDVNKIKIFRSCGDLTIITEGGSKSDA